MRWNGSYVRLPVERSQFSMNARLAWYFLRYSNGRNSTAKITWLTARMHPVEHTRSGRETRDCLTSRRRNSWSEKYDLRYMLSYVGWVAFDWKSFAISRLRSLFVPRMRNYHSQSHNTAVSNSLFSRLSHRNFLRTEKRPAPADFRLFLANGSPSV